MKFFDKFLMVIYTLGVMAALFVFGLVSLGWTAPVNLLQISLMHDRERIIIGSVILFYLFLSMKFFLQSLSGPAIPEQAVVKETEMGQIRVSIEALENMVYRVAYQVKGVREVRPRVSCHPEGVNVFVKAVLSPDVNVPETTNEIQSSVRNQISEIVGINVASVKILVDDISSEAKHGMPRKLN